MLSIYGGTGVIGSYFCGLFPHQLIPREQLSPLSDRVLYLISTTSNSYDNPLLHSSTNIDCLLQRLVACQQSGVKEFNFVSSWFVYGHQALPAKEDDCCRPRGLYSITKHCAEQLVIDFCSFHGIAWRIFRLGNVYGGPDASDGSRNALHFIVQELKANRPVSLTEEVRRDYIHIYDVCRAMDHLTKAPVNTIYNVGTGLATPLADCAAFCQIVLESTSPIVSRPWREGEQWQRAALDCSRLFDTGFVPSISLGTGLIDLCTHQKFSTPAHFLTAPKFRQQ